MGILQHILFFAVLFGCTFGCNVAEQNAVPDLNREPSSSESEDTQVWFTSVGQTTNEMTTNLVVSLRRSTNSRYKEQDVYINISGTVDSDDHSGIYYNGTLLPSSGIAQIPFEVGQYVAQITVTLNQDATYEPDEQLIFSIASVQTDSGIVSHNPPRHTINVKNDDYLPKANFLFASSTAVEGNNKNVTIELSNTSHLDATVLVKRIGGTATAADHDFSDQYVTIPAGSTTANIFITPVDEGVNELDETLILQVVPFSGADFANTQETHTLTIIEAGAQPQFSFDVAADTLTESSSLTVQINFTGTFDKDLYLPFDVGGTAIMGKDFLLSQQYVYLPMGSSSATFDITPIDDTFYEEDKTIVFTLSDQDFGVAAGNTTMTATLTDDDSVPTISFLSSSYSASEGSTLYIPIKISPASDDRITLTYTVGGSATGTSDYIIPNTTTIDIAPGVTKTQIPIYLVDDTEYESVETVSFSLSGPTFSNYVATPSLGISSTTLSIQETNTMPSISFQSETLTVDEGDGSFNIVVELDSASAIDHDFAISISGGAESGVDYTMPATGHTITASNTTYTINVPLLNDIIQEPTDYLTVSLLQPSDLNLGTISTLTVGITDDDDPSDGVITAANTSVDEGNQDTFTLTLDKPSEYDIEIPVTFSGTAVKGTDYTVSAESFVIPAGSMSDIITVSAIDDGAYDGATADQIQVDVVGGTYHTISTGTATMDINDAEAIPKLFWSTPATHITAYEGTILEVKFELEHPTYQDVVVEITASDNYGTNCGGACAEIIYDPSESQDTDLHLIDPSGVFYITIPAGKTSGYLSFTLIDDIDGDTPETNEQFMLSLTNVDDVLAATIDTADDDLEFKIANVD